MILILLGAVVRGTIGQKGLLAMHEGETHQAFHSRAEDRDIPLPFSVRLVEFDVTYHEDEARGPNQRLQRLIVHWREEREAAAVPIEIGVGQRVQPENAPPVDLRILRQVPHFSKNIETGEVTSQSDEWINPAIEVEVVFAGQTNITWLFARYPDLKMHGRAVPAVARPFDMYYDVQVAQPAPGMVDAFKSTVEILDGGKVSLSKVIQVNDPLSYKGYAFYQYHWREDDLTYTVLQVVYDPGVPLVYVGFGFMILGLILIFYVYPGGGNKRRPAAEESS